MCQGTDRLYGTTDSLFSVVKCCSCELIRLYPWPSPKDFQRYYPTNYWFRADDAPAARLEEQYRRFVLRDHVSFVKRALGAPATCGPVLDVGCGGGLFPRMLREAGYTAHGLDFATDAAKVAWRVNRVPTVAGLLPQAPFAAESLGGVSLFHVLEHLYEPREYVESAWRLLRPGGKLVVQVPNVACWQFSLLGVRWNGLDIPRHLVNFRAKDVSSLLASCGFEILRQKFFSLRDNPAGLATSLAPSLDPMARRVRGVDETPRQRLGRDVLYLGLVAACLPFAAAEAAFRAGSTVMIEARKK